MRTQRQQNGLAREIARVSIVFLYVATGVMGFVARASAAPTPSSPLASMQGSSQFAIGDFDGDSRPDLATLQAGETISSQMRYWVRFQLSTGLRQTVSITAPTGGLQITSRDVNGDNFLDVIVTTAWTNLPVAVLLNDGRGDFTRSDPSAFPVSAWTLQTCCTCTEIKEPFAVLVPRASSGACVQSSSSSAHFAIDWVAQRASRSSSFSLIVSFLGRAPPSFVLYT